MCKIKKGTKKKIQAFTTRLYEDSIKNRLKMEEKKRNYILYENDTSKYKTKLNPSNYNFIDDEDDLNNFNNNQIINKMKNQHISEFNNLRFEKRNKSNERVIKNENIPQFNKYNSCSNILNDNTKNKMLLNKKNDLEEIENKKSNNNNINEEQINNIIYQNPNIQK